MLSLLTSSFWFGPYDTVRWCVYNRSNIQSRQIRRTHSIRVSCVRAYQHRVDTLVVQPSDACFSAIASSTAFVFLLVKVVNFSVRLWFCFWEWSKHISRQPQAQPDTTHNPLINIPTGKIIASNAKNRCIRKKSLAGEDLLPMIFIQRTNLQRFLGVFDNDHYFHTTQPKSLAKS